MKLVVKEIIKETADAVSICFKNGGLFNKLNYKPGQFVTLDFPIANEVHKRAYSFSSNPFTDKDLKITVKRVEKGLVSNFVHDQLKIGDKLQVDKPNGSFFVEPEKKQERHYKFFAGGSGITPIFSIIKSILEREPKSKILLVYANHDVEAIIFRKELDALEAAHKDRLRIAHLISHGALGGPKYHKGLITDALVENLFEKYGLYFDDGLYMICGPFGFMEAVKSILHVNGVAPGKIKVELFKRPTVVKQGKDLISQVAIQLNNSNYDIQVTANKSILQAAMAKNIALPYSCRSGMCASCKATCISGKITMTEGHLLPPEEVAAGKILTCISYPASEHIVIAV